MLKFLKIINLIIVVTIVSYIVVKHPERARIRVPLFAGDIPIPTYLLIFLCFFLGALFTTYLYGKTIWSLKRKLKKSGYFEMLAQDDSLKSERDDHVLSPTKDIAID